jgi:inhibitor of KinA sporulation pathway (predicted exonuclease)
MARRLDQVLVIDIECTCWDGPPPAGEDSEIIEIGLCPLDISTGRRLGKQSLLVRPTRSRVSAFCTKLTTLTQEQVERGGTFADACQTLRRDYFAADRLWASAGDYDRRMFEKQCRQTNVPYPFGPSHLNVKTLFAVGRALPTELGVDGMLGVLGLPLEGTHHRGDDDAWNIALILAKLLASLRKSASA